METQDPLWAYGKFVALTMLRDVRRGRSHLAEMSPELLKDKPTVHPIAIDHAALAAYMLDAAGETEQSHRILKAVIAATDKPGATKSVQGLIWRVGAFAQLGDHDRAKEELKQLIALGYRTPIDTVNYIHVSENPLFDGLRKDKEFQSLMAEVERDLRRMRANVEKRHAAEKAAGKPLPMP